MADVGFLTPAQQTLVWETIQQLRASGVLSMVNRTAPLLTPPPKIYVRNQSGEEIPAYGCMRVTSSVELNGQNYLNVQKPNTDTDATYLLNGRSAIADGEFGIAQDGYIQRALTDGGAYNVKDKGGPIDDEWYIDQGSDLQLFQMVGTDDIADDVLKFARSEDSADNTFAIYKTPVGGLPARASLTPGSATCTRYSSSDLATSTGSATVKNPWLFALPADYFFLAQFDGANYVAINPGIINLRLSGSNLQSTYDGTTWATWHTATECP